MFKHIITTAVLSSALTIGSLGAAMADGGGMGGNGGMFARNVPYASMKNPDGSRATSIGLPGRERLEVRQDRKRRITKVKIHRKNFRNRRGERRSRPWAYNNTTGRGSVGVRPGVRVTFGGGRGIGVSLSF